MNGEQAPKLNCHVCKSQFKLGEKCKVCKLYDTEHFVEGIGSDNSDFLCILDAPSKDIKIYDIGANKHQAYNYGVEGIIWDTIRERKNNEYKDLNGWYTYCVKCYQKKPTKKIINNCKELLIQEINTYFPDKEEIPVLTFGRSFLQCIGYKVKRYNELLGKTITVTFEGKKLIVFVTYTKPMLESKEGGGYYTNFLRHLTSFFDIVDRLKNKKALIKKTPLEKISENYVIPRTVKEVKEVVDEIINYSTDNKPVEDHFISIDTETNTLFPQFKEAKIFVLSCAWDDGKAVAIPLEHPDTPYNPKEIYPDIQRLLSCKKPKIAHNAKYDIKILSHYGWKMNRLLWDTMLFEHLLEESKPGHYSLKSLVNTFFPEYGGYEDKIQDQLQSLGGEALIEVIRKEKKRKKKKKKTLKEQLILDKGFSDIAFEDLLIYAAIDADLTRRLATLQNKRMIQEDKRTHDKIKNLRVPPSEKKKLFEMYAPQDHPLKNASYSLVLPLTEVLAEIEMHGINIDKEYLEKLIKEVDSGLLKLELELIEMIPNELRAGFNLNSNQQVVKLLFGSGYRHPDTNEIVCHKGRIEPKLTDLGTISVDAEALKNLVGFLKCPFAEKLLLYRTLAKARNTFLENVKQLGQFDNRMHCNFHQHRTVTYRLSSSDENMQNIPKFIGKHNIKKLFIPSDPENQVFVNLDAKAAEIRVFAAYTKDRKLIDGFNNGVDPHSLFSSRVFSPEFLTKGMNEERAANMLNHMSIDNTHSWSYKDFVARNEFKETDPPYGNRLEEIRTNMKSVVFGIFYGSSAKGISYQLRIPLEQAEIIVDMLMKEFPSIRRFISQTHEQVRNLQMVQTFLGRKRRLNLRGLTNFNKYKAYRQSVNSLIQSTSSDIVTTALCDMYYPLKSNFNAQILLTVHDSIGLEMPKKYVRQLPEFVYEYGTKKIGQKFPWMPVEFLWDIQIGPSYGELKPIEDYLKNN